MLRSLDSVEELGRQNTVFMLQSLREWNRGLQEIGTETLGFRFSNAEKLAHKYLRLPSFSPAAISSIAMC